MEFIKVFITLVIFLIIDIPMLTIINKDMYLNQLDNINNGLKIDTTIIATSAIITYVLLAYGLYYFAIKPKSILNGALFGLIVYGVYDFTNLATIAKYSVKVAILDTIWGAILCTLVTTCVLFFYSDLK
jgi:uncharacterized membrane protein